MVCGVKYLHGNFDTINKVLSWMFSLASSCVQPLIIEYILLTCQLNQIPLRHVDLPPCTESVNRQSQLQSVRGSLDGAYWVGLGGGYSSLTVQSQLGWMGHWSKALVVQVCVCVYSQSDS